jgi:hypothetical protein
MKVTLADGMVLEGTQEQIESVLGKMGVAGDELFYKSDSKGLVLIEEMQSIHLRNAILKMYAQWVDSLHKIAEPKEVVNQILEGIQDKTWVAMVKVLSSREE